MAQPNVTPPSLPLAPPQYDREFFDKLNSIFRLYFNQLNNPGPMTAASLNLNLNTLPTDAVLATLRPGDVYRDTATNVLKIKT
jgi:hypothetical protein